MPQQPSPETERLIIHLGGETFTLSQADVLTVVRAVLAEGVPPEAKRFESWFLAVDGERVSTKWVISLVTGLPTNRFKTDEARRGLHKLGLEAQRVEQAEATHPDVDLKVPAELTREAFYRAVLAHLEGKLPPGVLNQRLSPQANYLQLTCHAPNSHYLLWLRRDYTAIAIHFEGPRERNLALLDQLKSHVQAWQEQLGEPVYAEPWGQNRARVYLKRPFARLDAPTAETLAAGWLRFIAVTLLAVEQAVADLGLRVGRGRRTTSVEDDDLKKTPPLDRESFYRAVLTHLEGKLPPGVRNNRVNPRVNYLQLTCPAPSTHYQLSLRRDYTELAIHFEGPRERNLALLDQFQPHANAWQEQLDGPVYAERWGEKYARVYLKRPLARLDAPTAETLAAGWLRFIQTTLPAVEQAVADLGLRAGQGRRPARLKGDDSGSPPELDREAFYRAVLAHLEGRLPADVHNRRLNPQANYLQQTCPAPATHYELYLRRDYTEIGIHFEGTRERNQALLDQFRPHSNTLREQLGEPVYIEPWGNNWAHVYLKRPLIRLDAPTAEILAADWLRFIKATLPVVEQAVADLSLRTSRGRPPVSVKEKDLDRPKTVLAEEVRKIRACLNGDQTPPSDEKLCDWVQFCYTFELFAEGVALFRLVRPDTVHPWLYERTHRLARACELRGSM